MRRNGFGGGKSSDGIEWCVGGLTIIDVGDLREEKIKEQDTVEETAVPGDSGDTILGERELFIVWEDRAVQGQRAPVDIHGWIGFRFVGGTGYFLFAS